MIGLLHSIIFPRTPCVWAAGTADGLGGQLGEIRGVSLRSHRLLQQQVALAGDAFLVSESLRVVLAQRLLRKVCPQCSHTYSPPDFHLALAHDLAKEYGFVLDIKDRGRTGVLS